MNPDFHVAFVCLQFIRAFPGPNTITEREKELLVQKYASGSLDVNYLKFFRDVEAISSQPAAPKTWKFTQRTPVDIGTCLTIGVLSCVLLMGNILPSPNIDPFPNTRRWPSHIFSSNNICSGEAARGLLPQPCSPHRFLR
jgi:hypothetical protein